MKRREMLARFSSGLIGGFAGAFLVTLTMSLPKPDEIDAVYERLCRKPRDAGVFPKEVAKKPDASRLIVHHDAEGNPIYSIAVAWWVNEHRNFPLISSEPVKDEVTAYRLWYGISNRYNISLEMENPQH
jgi:hypothetical protein